MGNGVTISTQIDLSDAEFQKVVSKLYAPSVDVTNIQAVKQYLRDRPDQLSWFINYLHAFKKLVVYINDAEINEI